MVNEMLQSGNARTGKVTPEEPSRAPVTESPISAQDIAALEQSLAGVPSDFAEEAAAAVHAMRMAVVSGQPISREQMQVARRLVEDATNRSSDGAQAKKDVTRDKLDTRPAPKPRQPRPAVRDLSFEEMIHENVARMQASGKWGDEFSPELVRMMYELADTDRNGQVTQHEIAQFLRDNGYGTKGAIDRSGDGRFSNSEFATILREIHDRRRAQALAQAPAVTELEEIVVTAQRRPRKSLDDMLAQAAQEKWGDEAVGREYNFLDTNHSRKLSVQELREGLKIQSIDDIDKDGDGRISAAEFQQKLDEEVSARSSVSYDDMVRQAWANELRQTDTDRLTEEEKSMIDTNNDGTVSQEELLTLLSRDDRGNRRSIDTNANYAFERVEFLNAIRKALLFRPDDASEAQAAALETQAVNNAALGEATLLGEVVVSADTGKVKFTTGPDHAGTAPTHEIMAAVTREEVEGGNVAAPQPAVQAPVEEEKLPPSMRQALQESILALEAQGGWASTALSRDINVLSSRAGTLTPEDLEAALRHSDKWELARLDTDNNLEISPDELVAGLTPIVQAKIEERDAARRLDDSLVESMNALLAAGYSFHVAADLNRSGRMDKEDFKLLLGKNDASKYGRADTNGDGVLSLDEVINGLPANLIVRPSNEQSRA